MLVASNWTDYEVIACGGGEKLERWGDVYLLRPDPQVIWDAPFDLCKFDKLNARYVRSASGGGQWIETKRGLPKEFQINYSDCTFLLKPMGFKHTGLFPEQAVNWDRMRVLIEDRNNTNSTKKYSVLNLFGYTGAASVMCAKAGATVTHVDAAKNMCERCGENARSSGVDNIRYIVDDCMKFVQKEIRRGKKYDAILLDPPSYGRGPTGEMWRLEDNIFSFAKECRKLLCDTPLFFLINSYTTGLQAGVMGNILSLVFGKFGGQISADEIGLPVSQSGGGKIVLPCGNSVFMNF